MLSQYVQTLNAGQLKRISIFLCTICKLTYHLTGLLFRGHHPFHGFHLPS